MPKLILITGDRSLPALLALAPVAVELLKQTVTHGGDVQFVTGTNDGVEAAARYVLHEAGVAHTIVENTPGEDGKPDWDARHKALAAQVDHVIMLHGDPLSSSIGKSLVAVFPDDKVTMLP